MVLISVSAVLSSKRISSRSVAEGGSAMRVRPLSTVASILNPLVRSYKTGRPMASEKFSISSNFLSVDASTEKAKLVIPPKSKLRG